ncbi:DUF3810 domain-containing protein [Epilithonimonas sp.]|uniref:DUF3810 domain-containing protein n=1 Tax=Epilithonimonas sp. TaxID=2894511 RepID=UPI00289B4B19|nr:DUF3810 domain-containing protein [Epilithonimonas sp.]
MDTKKNIFIKNKLWAIILVAQFSLFYILSKFEFAIQFFSDLFEWKKNVHVRLFSGFELSVGDLTYTIVVLFFIYSIIGLFRHQKRIHIKKILIFLNTFYFIYQCFWGMLYFQTPIIEKLEKKDYNNNDLKTLTLKYLALCKQTREKTSEDKDGVFRVKNLNEIKLEILRQQHFIPKDINSKKSINILSVKPSLFNSLMDYTGILGYYNPFTAESQFNPNIPSTQLPFTLAHEMSHQLGYAREQEASFIAYLCSKNSNNTDLQYSYQLYVLKSLLRNLSKTDIAFVKHTIDQFSVKMKRDRNDEIQFYRENEGLISDLFGVTNDLFLKSNQQDGQISYSYFINLLIRYELR